MAGRRHRRTSARRGWTPVRGGTTPANQGNATAFQDLNLNITTCLFDAAVGLAQIVEAMQQTSAGTSSVASVSAPALAPVQTPEIRAMSAMRDFYLLKPPTFQGQSDAVVAAEWMGQIVRTFDALLIYEEDLRVRLASFQFRGNARRWWETVRFRVGMSWTDFRETFLERYVF